MEASEGKTPPVVVAAVWIIAILLATQLDALVATGMRDAGAVAFLKDSHRPVAEILKLPGEYWFILVLAGAVAWMHPLKWQAGAFLALCGAVSGANALIKWSVGRTRPFKGIDPLDLDFFRWGVSGLFHQTNLCFPSGHATLAFAAAEALRMLFPKYRAIFYVTASITAVERVLEAAHYLSDAVGGAALGIFGTRFIAWIIRQCMDERESWRQRLAPTFQQMGNALLRVDDEMLQVLNRAGWEKGIDPPDRGTGDPPVVSKGHRRVSRATVTSVAPHDTVLMDPSYRQVPIPPARLATVNRHHPTPDSQLPATPLPDSVSLEIHATCAEDDAPMNDAPYLSLVIPCYNEEENVAALLHRVGASLDAMNKPYEVLLIDDGSTDTTPQLLTDARSQYPWLRVLRMVKNGGQSAAFEAGFEAALGQIIATIDADLQNDPEEIPRLVQMLEAQNVDMITGWRKERQDTSFRRWQSRQANRLRNWITQETVNDSASSLKLYRAHAIKGIKLFRGAHRYFPTLVKLRGYTVFETPVKHSARHAGVAKYGFGNRAFVGLVDLFGVRWMKKRYLRYQVTEVPPPTRP